MPASGIPGFAAAGARAAASARQEDAGDRHPGAASISTEIGRNREDLGLRLGMRLCRTSLQASRSSPAASVGGAIGPNKLQLRRGDVNHKRVFRLMRQAHCSCRLERDKPRHRRSSHLCRSTPAPPADNIQPLPWRVRPAQVLAQTDAQLNRRRPALPEAAASQSIGVADRIRVGCYNRAVLERWDRPILPQPNT